MVYTSTAESIDENSPNFKLGCFVMYKIAWPIQAWPSLHLNTWPRLRPVNLSLSMARVFDPGKEYFEPWGAAVALGLAQQ
jgi:hypothetical protein